MDPKLVHRVFAFLERYGSINFGVYKQLKPSIKCKLYEQYIPIVINVLIKYYYYIPIVIVFC